MAKKVMLVDDLDGTEVDEETGGTLVFSIDGEYFSIDLGAKNRAAFDKAVQKFVDAAVSIEAPHVQATPVRGRSGRSAPRSQGSPGANRERLQLIREWARANGYEVSDRGRVAMEIQEAYEAAGGK